MLLSLEQYEIESKGMDYDGRSFVRKVSLANDVRVRVIAGAIVSDLTPKGLKKVRSEFLTSKHA